MKKLLSYIPGTRTFYVRNRHAITGEVQARLKQLDVLQLTPETLSRITTKVGQHEYRLVKRSISENAVLAMFMFPLMIVGLMSMLSGLFVSSLWPRMSTSALGPVWNFFLYFVSLWLTLLVVSWPFILFARPRRRRKRSQLGTDDENGAEEPSVGTTKRSSLQFGPKTMRKASGYSLFMFIWIGIVISLYIFLLYHYLKAASVSPPSVIVYLMIEGITGFLGYIAFIGIASLTALPIQIALKRRTNTKYPDSVLVHGLQDIAYLLRTRPEAWNDLEFKRRLMSELETSASCIQYLPRRLKSGDAFTDVWIRERSTQIAAAIRSLKQWIVTPMWNTYDRLCSHVTDSFLQAVDGNWDGLERIDPPKLSQRQFYARVGGIVGGVLLSALPLVGLFVLQKSQFKLEGATADYAKLMTIGWAVVSLLSTFDPTFNAKLSAVKEIASSLTPGGKGK
jgi:hypothetical protein